MVASEAPFREKPKIRQVLSVTGIAEDRLRDWEQRTRGRYLQPTGAVGA